MNTGHQSPWSKGSRTTAAGSPGCCSQPQPAAALVQRRPHHLQRLLTLRLQHSQHLGCLQEHRPQQCPDHQSCEWQLPWLYLAAAVGRKLVGGWETGVDAVAAVMATEAPVLARCVASAAADAALAPGLVPTAAVVSPAQSPAAAVPVALPAPASWLLPPLLAAAVAAASWPSASASWLSLQQLWLSPVPLELGAPRWQSAGQALSCPPSQ